VGGGIDVAGGARQVPWGPKKKQHTTQEGTALGDSFASQDDTSHFERIHSEQRDDSDKSSQQTQH
jgi:hypothetical protein